MSAPIVIAGTLDTKSEEIGFLRDELLRLGRSVVVIDCGVLGEASIPADVDRAKVARLGGGDIEVMRRERVRADSMPVMVRGLETVLRDRLKMGAIGGFVVIGGGTNAAFAAAGFRVLPFGLPKMLVSTVACGNTRPFVGMKDVMLLHSVVDVLGLNAFLRDRLRQAAAALSAMAGTPDAEEADTRPCVAVTSFGATTPAAERAVELLGREGFEVLCFHARGIGGEAMEAFVREGRVQAVLDLTTTEIADELVGGICSAGPDRLTAAGELAIPQVVLPGAVDIVNFGPMTSVPEAFRERRLTAHTANATLMRTTPAENEAIARFIADRLNAAKGPTAVVLPGGAFSLYGAEGGPFHEPAADEAFRQALLARLAPGVDVERVEGDINDAPVIDAAVSRLLSMIRKVEPK